MLLCALIVKTLFHSASSAKTTRRPSASQKTLLPLLTLNNGAFKPTAMTSLPSQSSVSSTSTAVDSTAPPTDASYSIWIHVGVGIAALIVVVVIGILVCFVQLAVLVSFCSAVLWYLTSRKQWSLYSIRHVYQLYKISYDQIWCSLPLVLFMSDFLNHRSHLVVFLYHLWH